VTFLGNAPDSAIINKYPIGGGIPPHIDHRDFDRPIFILRLWSDTRLSFGGPFSSFNDKRKIKFKVNHKRGEVIKMEGYIANKITHSVEPNDVNIPTGSLTLRKVIKKNQKYK